MSFSGKGVAVLLVFAAAMAFAAFTFKDAIFGLLAILGVGFFLILVIVFGLSAGSAIFRFK